MFFKPPPISFHVHKATPTTISYVVSTKRHTTTHAGKALFYVGLILRIIFGSYGILTCWILWQLFLDKDGRPASNYFETGSLVSKVAWALACEVPIQYLLVILVICFWAVLRRGYKGEQTSFIDIYFNDGNVDYL